MRHYIVFIVSLFTFFVAKAQTNKEDSLIDFQLKEFVKSGYLDDEKQDKTALIVQSKLLSNSAKLSFSLSEELAQVSGVNMLSTGLAINKPVIRGMYGNRVLILVSGLKFDNMQWQEEHGLRISTMGLSKAEIIKGPIGVLYGSEAIGGVINLIEELPPTDQKHHADANLVFNSNTLGGKFDAGYKKRVDNKWLRIRVGAESNADYTDGNNNRVLNSRFEGYSLKTSFGFENKKWESKVHFMSSYNRYGFIFNDIYDFVYPDERYSRQLTENPAHLVALNILSTENKITINDKTKLFVNIGLQSNNRKENEGAGAISLDMLLLSFQSLVKVQHQLSRSHTITVSTLNSVENNQNNGFRKIVPNATMQESNLSVHSSKKIGDKFVLENGIGIGEKFIQTTKTTYVNDHDEIKPFSKQEYYYNALSGFSYSPTKYLLVKLNLSTGVRVPNLAELSSNGLHEGVFTYEIGDPNMKNEQIFSCNTSIGLVNKLIQFTLTPFYNRFNGYVYLSPTNEQWYGFPVYRFKQQNATQYGTEIDVNLKLNSHFTFNMNGSAMNSKTDDGQYTPFIPPLQFNGSVHYQHNLATNWKIKTFLEYGYWDKQHRVADNEIKTPSYNLINAGVNFNLKKNNCNYQFGITGKNLLNEAYYDHLSRFKYFGLLNIGRNIAFNLKFNF